MRLKQRLTRAKSIFRSEFLNRIDETVVFKQLKNDELKQIVGLMLADMTHELFAEGDYAYGQRRGEGADFEGRVRPEIRRKGRSAA